MRLLTTRMRAFKHLHHIDKIGCMRATGSSLTEILGAALRHLFDLAPTRAPRLPFYLT